MPSPKHKRRPPSRNINDYVLYRVVSPEMNLCAISDSAMQNVWLSGPGSTSGVINIGFDFTFHGVTYKQLSFSNSGLVVLFDPLCTLPTVADVVFPNESGAYTLVDMGRVRTNGFSPFIGSTANRRHAVLIPWGGLQRSLLDGTSLSYTANVQAAYTAGIIPKPILINESQHGCFIYRDDKHPAGRRFIIRFNIKPNASNDDHYRFDCVIYENGTIEYRYAPRGRVAFSTGSSASTTSSIGVFLSGTSTEKLFRDFSFGLGYRDDARTPYVNGGYVYTASYFDNTGSQLESGVTPYTAQLRADVHWPSPESGFGAAYIFRPPQLRKSVLPRIERRALDTRKTYPVQSRQGTINPADRTLTSLFDDRRTVSFTSGVLLNAPIMNQRFFGQPEFDTVARQGLFSDFEFTGSITKDQEFIDQNLNPTFTKPFNEHQRYELELDSEFASGSSLDDFGFSLVQPTSAKTQIRFSLPVYRSTAMPATTSSLYYYNLARRQWLIPQNTSHWNGDYLVSPAFYTDWMSVRTSYFASSSVLHDARGFGPIGNYLASGTTATTMSRANHIESVAGLYTKSVLLGTEYRAQNDEVFTLPINRPFLLERMVVEVPLRCGPGWLNDKTTARSIVQNNGQTPSSIVDFAGPAITFALLHQESFADGSSKRSIIASGTVTHTFDNTKELKWDATSTHNLIYPSGYLSFDSTPAAILSASSTGSFVTGTVSMKMIAAVSNGQTIRLSRTTSTLSEVVAQFSASHFPLIGQDATAYLKTGHINPLGRGGHGLEVSGRSTFGRELSTNLLDRVENPFNPTYYDTVSFDVDAVINDGNAKNFSSVISAIEHKRSPYLIMPGDTLVFAASKMRPLMVQDSITPISSAQTPGHDVQFHTGSINIIMYGSTLSENVEYHDTLNQSLYSDAIHEVSIGNDPVIDQFDVEYRGSYIGSSTDDYVTGSLVTVSTNAEGRSSLLTGSRARLFNGYFAHLTPNYVEHSKLFSAGLRPWYENVGGPRHVQVTDASETWYDSLVPNIDTCVKINSASIYAWTPSGPRRGLIVFNNASLSSDNVWFRSFPFEPRYSTVNRIRGFFLSVSTTKKITGGDFGISTISNDEARTITGINVLAHYIPGGDPKFYGDSMDALSSENYGTTTLTGADSLRVLYGFGDHHALFNGNNANNVNNMPSFSQHPSASYLAIAPVIRGWKYGLVSGIETKTKAYWRRGRYGQNRDQLEQRPYTKFIANNKIGISPVTVRFVTANGTLTNAENTWSSNLSNEATSSIPYIDGYSTNRNEINTNTINQGIISFNNDNGNLTL